MPRYPISFTLLLLLLGCAGAPAPPITQPSGTAAGFRLQPPTGARRHEIVGSASLLQVRVYREGALAAAGHNHVIALRDLRGRAWLTRERRGSLVQMEVELAGISVDEPELRAAAGTDFPGAVPDAARRGTRDNLLGPALLDVARYPTLRLEGRWVAAAGAEPEHLAATLWIKDRDVTIDIPLQLQQDGRTLVASGEFPLRQSDIGLTPFAVMLGALRVRDEMQLAFRIVAQPASD